LEGLVSFCQDLPNLASPSKHVPQFRPVHDLKNHEALICTVAPATTRHKGKMR